MKNLKFLAITIAIIVLSGCGKTCYDQNNQPYDCTTGVPNNGGGTGSTTWWNGPLPFSATSTIQVRVMDSNLQDKKDNPRNYSVLADMDLSHYIDMIFGGPVHSNIWIQGRMNYGGAYYWVKFTTTNPKSLTNNEVITVTISSDHNSPFALNVNSYNSFNSTYYDATGGMPTINMGSASSTPSPLYNAEGIYARQ